ncbi:MAG: tryptophan-rich sensory protein [Thermoflexales bacterium]|nr:tryptophan-rich sensory protein [Thermoflexales bacterium]
MKDKLRQILVVLTILVTLVINGLANALPINGLNTGQISDRFQVYFVPAGYVFSIWGLIYLGLIAFAIFQALPAQRENPRMCATGWWIVLGGLANSAWILLWHYEQFPLTVIVMLVLLATLIITYLRMGTGRTRVSTVETWAARVPFSVYLGWITVATIANITSVLDYLRWDGWGISPEAWTLIMLAAGVLIASAMSLTRGDVAYMLVILWAFVGIALKHAAVPAVATGTWVATVLVGVMLVVGVFVTRRRGRAAQAN